MALLRGKAPKHQNWITAPAASYAPSGASYLDYPSGRRSYVGASTAEDAREVIRLIDEIAIYFPVTAAALALQESIFKWAELFGVKDQVEYAVYALRAASGVNTVATGSVIIPAGGVTSASVSTALAGAGALGVVVPLAGAAIAVVAFLSSGDDEELAKKRRKRAQADIQHLRERLTLAQFVSEQRDSATSARATAAQPPAILSLLGLGPEDAARLKAEADTADKLAALYDKADKELPADQKAIFETLSNLGRWRAVLQSYSKMSTQQREDFDSIGFGTKQSRLPFQLKSKIAAEEVTIRNLATIKPAGSMALGAVLVLGSAGVIAYILAPSLALGAAAAIWARAKRGASYVTDKARGIV